MIRLIKSLGLVLLLALLTPGCSRFSKSGRQERAYSKYVRKMSANRDKQRLQEIKQRAEMPKLRPTPSEPVENVQVSESQ
jgi:PBP1b-binding outer membrane lipoprotein LpoB